MNPSLFPLPLVPFERYMLLDDRPDYPMTCVWRLQLTGTLDREAFEDALGHVSSHHPLVTALVDCSRPRKPCWISGRDVRPAIDWDAPEGPVKSPRPERIDLESETGIRFRVRQQAGRAVVAMFFHHTCCDGIGAARFIEDLLAVYATRVAGRPAPPPDADTRRLPCRGRVPRVGRFPARVVQEIRTFLKEGRHWLFHPVTPLGCPDRLPGPDSTPVSLADFPSHTLDRQVSTELRAAAKRRGATLNDLFLAAMFHTICRWNETHAPQPQTPWLRISVPQNLREQADRWMPAANKVTMSFITRGHEACRDPASLFEGIRKETINMRRWLRGKSLIRGMRIAFAVPGLMARVLSPERCLATVVLSNVGDCDRWFCPDLPREGPCVRAGDVVLDGLAMVPPVRPNTRAAFCITGYGGRLNVSVQCDPHVFTVSEAQDLLEQYTSELKAIAGRPE